MQEQFDKKLADKIKSSFKDLEGEFDPSEWDKFSKKYFRSEASRMALRIKWVSGMAAALILGITLFTIFQPAKNQSSDIPNIIAFSSEENPSKDKKIAEEDTITENKSDSDNQTKMPVAENKKNSNVVSQSKSGIKTSLQPNTQKQENSISAPPVKSGSSNLAENNNATERPVTITEKSSTDLDLKIQPQEMTSQEALAQIQEWKGEETTASRESILKETNVNVPVKLGVLLAPQTISNSTQSINFGAGLMSELSFSRKLKLDVGMAYARHNISPTSGGTWLMAGVANDMASESLRAASFTGNVINTSRELSFGQLEIPVNLKYKVLDKKESGIYLISGLSNMVYLNQQDVTTYSTANLASVNFAGAQSMLKTFSQTVEPDPQSNGLDTGRMLNFGIGFEQNLKNGTFLSIEPFYKLPLGDQTFSNQQFSMGGINLRMNFQLKSKKE
jgi:hypothetical protein